MQSSIQASTDNFQGLSSLKSGFLERLSTFETLSLVTHGHSFAKIIRVDVQNLIQSLGMFVFPDQLATQELLPRPAHGVSDRVGTDFLHLETASENASTGNKNDDGAHRD